MGFVVFIVLFLIACYEYNRKKEWMSPIVIFCLEWSLITLLAQLRLFSLYSVSIKTWLIIFVGCLSFVMGCIFAKKYSIHSRIGKLINNKKEKKFYLMKKKTYISFLVIFAVVQIYEVYNVIGLITSGVSLSEIRLAYYGFTQLEGYSSGILSTGVSTYLLYIRDALSNIITVIGIYSFLKNRKVSFLVLVTILNIFTTLSTGGRFALIFLVIEAIVCYGIVKKKERNEQRTMSVKVKRVIRVISVVMLLAVLAATFARGSFVVDILETLYVYICGDVVLCDLHIARIDALNFHSFGFASLYGIWSLILPIFNKIGITYPYIYTLTQQNVMTGQDWLQIGESLWSNAFLTPFYYLYADASWLGVVLGMSGFGYFAERSYINAMRSENGYNVCMYLIVVQMMFITLQTFPLTNAGNIVIMIIFYISAGVVRFTFNSRKGK